MPGIERVGIRALAAALALAPWWAPASAQEASAAASEAADAALRARVQRALAADERARDLGVTVEVRGGVAIVRGRAPHLAARESAVHAAALVPGLLDVRDEIEIPPHPGGDTALRAALEEALMKELRSVRVEAEVKGGSATLRGTVGDTTQRAAARNRAMRVEGLRGLDNQIVVKTEAGFDDRQLRLRLTQLIENRRLYPLQGDISVQVRDRRVTLGGEVPRVYDRLIAERVVGILSGILGVDNEIRVVPGQGRELRQQVPLQ